MILPRNDGVLWTLRASATTLSFGGMVARGLTAACDTLWGDCAEVRQTSCRQALPSRKAPNILAISWMVPGSRSQADGMQRQKRTHQIVSQVHVIRRTQRRSVASISAFKSPDRERHSQVAAVAHFCRSSAGHEGASAHISLRRTRAYRCAGLQQSPSSVRRVRTDGYCQEWHVAGRWA